MPTRDWQFLIWKSTATSLSTSLVDLTVTNAQLASVPVITGSRLRILDGRTEARPWTVDILDSSSFFTSQIASGGRADLLNRFVQARLSIDGSTYQPVAGGRLVDAVNADNIATWRITVQDEWLSGANALLFTTNTTFLYPPRPLRGYKDVGSGWAAIGTATRVTSTTIANKRYWKVSLTPAVPGTPALTDEGAGFIRQDVSPSAVGLSTRPAFTHTRFRYADTDYPVVSFQTLRSLVSVVPEIYAERPDAENRLFDSDDLYNHQVGGQPLTFWVAASSTAFGGAATKTFTLGENYDYVTKAGLGLHAMSAPASNATPLHIWNWSTSNPFGTLHPMQVLKDIVSGVYSSSSEAMPYYSTQAFTGTADVRRLPTVGTAFRITQTATLKDWVEEHLLAPHGVAAFGGHDGKVTFKNVLLPDPQLGYSTASLYSFTSTNLRAPHPDWRTSRREQVTQLQLRYEQVQRTKALPSAPGKPSRNPGAPSGWMAGGDGLSVNTPTTFLNHDRIARFGVWPVAYTFDGYGAVDQGNYAGFPVWLGAFPYYKGEVAQRIFNRFGDGPIGGTLSALPGASTVRTGDFVRLRLDSYPNIGNSARGGTRLVQILSRDITPEGYQFEYLDAGDATIPTAPTLSLSTSTSFPKHALRVTVSAGIPSSGYVALYAADSATTTPPGSTSAVWHPVYPTTTPVIRSTGTYQIGQLKSGTRYFVKGQAHAPNKPRSNYSSLVNKVTGSLTAPSALSMSSVKAKTAGATWTVGERDYPVDWHMDTSTSGTPTTSNLLYRLPPGTDRTLTANLTPSQAYRAWVRHADPYGGYSSFDSTTFTMTSTASTSNSRKAPVLGGMYLVFGST